MVLPGLELFFGDDAVIEERLQLPDLLVGAILVYFLWPYAHVFQILRGYPVGKSDATW